jgi:putative peptide modification system cyclase
VNAVMRTEAALRRDAPAPMLRTLVLCDLADSTALVERLGDLQAAELFRKHDRLARTLVHQHGGREIDKTDGFLLMFDRPVEAVAFALAYQRALRGLDHGATQLRARVGIHFGDVIAWDNTPDDIAKGAKPFEIEGLVKPITSRLMQLALPGQILLSGVAYQLAHRGQDELGDAAATALWRTHGRYRFKGLPDPVPVFEVGEKEIAPLKAPPWSGKAHREVPFWRRPATMAVEVLALLVLVAVPLWYLLRPEPAIAFAQRDWVVVGSLRNLTDDTSFDDSIETAFRLGLEQSRYINVLSDLRTRDTVRLMQRDPEQTKVDRAVGSEVAIRNGARALILPTVAEIGGRVRVTAEVIDPNTETAVWSESADGVGAESVLPSLDKVNQKLRVRLGEALATVSSESQPLDKVATKNLDALRAYSLAERAYNVSNDNDALSLYRQAIKLDPEFALAHIGLARMLVLTDRRPEAIRELDLVLKTRDRLSAKDALYAEAWQLSLEDSQRAALEKWRLASELYPDFFAAHGLYAFFGWQFANRFDSEIVAAAKMASSPRNPNASTSLLLLGMLELGNEHPDEAIRTFDAAQKSGLKWHFDYALPHAARRDFAEVDKVFADGTSGDIDAYIQRVAVELDRGAIAAGRRQLDAARRVARESRPAYLHLFDAIDLGIAAAMDPHDASRLAALRGYAGDLGHALADATDGERNDLRFELAFAAYLAARMDDTKTAHSALDEATKAPVDDDPVLARMVAVANAEIARASGNAAEAIAKLKPTFDGSELYLAHVALMDAYAAHGDSAPALEEARWIAGHRGRAYAEYNMRQLLAPSNVIASNLALLRAAELAHAAGDEKAAHASIDAFRKAWPNAAGAEPIARRLKSLGKDP